MKFSITKIRQVKEKVSTLWICFKLHIWSKYQVYSETSLNGQITIVDTSKRRTKLLRPRVSGIYRFHLSTYSFSLLHYNKIIKSILYKTFNFFIFFLFFKNVLKLKKKLFFYVKNWGKYSLVKILIVKFYRGWIFAIDILL